MVDVGAHCFPPATISDESGATWESVSPFLRTLGPSSGFSGATIWASYGVEPDEPVSLWLSVTL